MNVVHACDGPRGLSDAVQAFLVDLQARNCSRHTYRAYATDLHQLAVWWHGDVNALTSEHLATFLASFPHLQPATRARKQAALASFCTWAYRHDILMTNPTAKLDRIQVPPPYPRALTRPQIETILSMIPRARRRDRLLFRLMFETGLRISEALQVYVEDIDLTLDDEHVRIVGKGGRVRTLLLDDAELVAQLRTYLRTVGYVHGPLFRAEKNGRGGPLRYQSVQAQWAQYCTQAGVRCTLHQLRHTHATELVNAGVSLATIRKRLGHKNLQTTLRYAEQSDAAADAELRAWRRQQRYGTGVPRQAE